METEVNNTLSSDTPTVSSQEPINSTPKSRKKLFMIGFGFLGVIMIVGVVGAIFGTPKNQSQNISPEKNTNNVPSSQKSFADLASGAIVYGFWSGDSSVINVLDIATNKNEPIATLALNIKHVKVVAPEKISYIKNTDKYDRGTQLVMYDINSKKETVILFADDTFGIDDYAISPNGKYLSAWEARNGSGSGTRLLGGRSRVYSVNTATQEKHLLYDETPTSSTPVHYPIAVTNTGVVFTDRFLPNSGAGWGYGMSMIDFAGLDSTDIPSMANGTYSTQPVVSPDGTKLVFAGYDGRNGSGAEVVGGYRRALIFPNTISTFDLSSLQRTTVITAKASDMYPSVSWNPRDGGILYTFESKEQALSGSYIINPVSSTGQKLFGNIHISSNSVSPVLQAVFGGNALLVSEQAVSFSNIGNLGSTYAGTISKMYVSAQGLKDKKELAIASSYGQFIGFMPQSYFTQVKNARIAEADTTKQNLQLETFIFKPNLAPDRGDQQSEQPPSPSSPPSPTQPSEDPGTPLEQACYGLATTICNQACGTHYTAGTAGKASDSCFPSCFRRALRTKNGGQVCFDSPLYLYGDKDTKVTVHVGTRIENPNAPYTLENGFDIRLLTNGDFTANGKQVDSLSFDYASPVKKLTRPAYGNVIEKSRLVETLKNYAARFGLNTREASDLVSYANRHISSSYILVSFYDDALSKQILPLVFNPEPEHYRNIVFYFEQFDKKPEFSVTQPVFEKVNHNGFSAVEISYILK